jgi:hypothetical protein
MSGSNSNAVLNWQQPQRLALLVAAGGLLVCGVGGAVSVEQFFRAYLVAYLFWLGIALGSLAILMLQNLTGGRWGAVLRRLLEAAVQTLPLLALLFVPLAFGLDYLYPWAGHIPADDLVLQEKTPYLNVPFFLVRAVLYFAAWLAVAWFLIRWSHAQEERYDPELTRRSRELSGPGLMLYGLGITFASIDWVMSLDPHWHSSIFGVVVAVGQLLPALAFAVLVLSLLARRPPLDGFVTPGLWNDLGNLLLAFVMLWAYVTFSQFLLIWSGNLPEEITWYRNRAAGGWQWVAWLLALGTFALPFLTLLLRGVKRHPRRLAYVAGVLVVMGFVHHLWLVAPTFGAHGHETEGTHEVSTLAWVWLDVAALCGLGGIWVALFLRSLAARPLLPRPEPLWQEVPAHG